MVEICKKNFIFLKNLASWNSNPLPNIQRFLKLENRNWIGRNLYEKLIFLKDLASWNSNLLVGITQTLVNANLFNTTWLFKFHGRVQKCHFVIFIFFFLNDTFEPVNEIWKLFWLKAFSWSIMKVAIGKNIHSMSSTKSRIYAGKSTKRGLSKKALVRIIYFFVCFRFLWIPQRPGTLN